MHWMRQRHKALWHTSTHIWQCQANTEHTSKAGISIDTEAGMLSGMSRKRSIRSNPYWFTEFCNSQCLSHFAAPFIVVRAETSVAESCVWCKEWTKPPESTSEKHTCCKNNGSFAAKEDSPILLHYPRTNDQEAATAPIPAQELTKEVHSEIVDACEWSFRRFTYGNLVTTSPSSE